MKVKSSKRGRPGKDESKLEKSRIVQTAREMTLSESKVPSIRRLASELNVDPMAIYYYFTNKQKLLEAVSISLISDLYTPENNLMWKENLMNLCRSYLSLLLNYPDLVSIILSISNEGAASEFMKRFEICIAELPLSQKKIKTIADLLVDYIHGFSFAVACNTSDQPITINMAEDPLTFIIENITDFTH